MWVPFIPLLPFNPESCENGGFVWPLTLSGQTPQYLSQAPEDPLRPQARLDPMRHHLPIVHTQKLLHAIFCTGLAKRASLASAALPEGLPRRPRLVSCNWTDTVHTLFTETRKLMGPRGPNTSQLSPHHSSFHQRIGTIADSHRGKFMILFAETRMLMGSRPQL